VQFPTLFLPEKNDNMNHTAIQIPTAIIENTLGINRKGAIKPLYLFLYLAERASNHSYVGFRQFCIGI
jgi:hypothetical protein